MDAVKGNGQQQQGQRRGILKVDMGRLTCPSPSFAFVLKPFFLPQRIPLLLLLPRIRQYRFNGTRLIWRRTSKVHRQGTCVMVWFLLTEEFPAKQTNLWVDGW